MLPTFIIVAVGLFSVFILGLVTLAAVFKHQQERRYYQRR